MEQEYSQNSGDETKPPATKNGMTAAQKKFFTGAAIIVCAIVYLIYSAIDTSASYYYKVAEVKAMGDRAQGVALRLEGNVAPGTIKSDSTNLKWNFSVEDDSAQSIPVYYEGVAPDMLQDEIAVVVEGKLNDKGQLVATKVLTSCPSRYDAAEEVKNEGGKNNRPTTPPHD